MNLLSLVLPLALLTGCTSVPMTDITVPLPDGRVARIKAPKDSELRGLLIQFSDGSSVRLDEYRARMNPEVIGQSTEQIKAHYAGSALLIKEGVAAASAAAK